jgi:hypothetical protein
MDLKIKILLVLSLFLVAGCTGGNNVGPLSQNYFEGYDGLEIEFIESKNPLTVYERTPIPLSILVSNDGALDIGINNSGKLSFTYDDFYLGYNEEDPLFNEVIMLHGKSYFYPEGEKSIVILPSFQSKVVKGPREEPETTLYVNLCYPYKTLLLEEVCIDMTSVTHDAREQVCAFEDLSFSDQGAPLAITSIEVEMQPIGQGVRPVFVVHVENKGSGALLSPVPEDKIHEACDVQYLQRANWSTVKVSAILSNDTLTCYPETMKLIGGKGFTRCMSTIPQYSAALNYYSPLRVQLDYVYTTSISKDIKIERTINYDLESLPLGECNYWEVKIGGVCIDKCSFCSSNPTNQECLNLNVPQKASCSCTPEECIINQMAGNDDVCLQDTSLCQDPYFCCISE